jgi:hypothetical protein
MMLYRSVLGIENHSLLHQRAPRRLHGAPMAPRAVQPDGIAIRLTSSSDVMPRARLAFAWAHTATRNAVSGTARIMPMMPPSAVPQKNTEITTSAGCSPERFGHDPRRQQPAFHQLHDSEHQQAEADQLQAAPGLEIGHRQHDEQADQRAEERHDIEQAKHQADQDAALQPDQP